ncbi:hypothetical protein ACFL60_09870, partial [Candidatus Omnitrophota bacterium]
DVEDMTPKMNYGALNEEYEFWSLKPELDKSGDEPQWETVVDNPFMGFRGGDKIPITTRTHHANYILKHVTKDNETADVLALVSSEVTEHHFNLYDYPSEGYMANDPVTEDIWSRSLQTIENDQRMINYVKVVREFRRQRALYLRAYPKMYTYDIPTVCANNRIYPIKDALVRITDEIIDNAKEWLWKQSDECNQRLKTEHSDLERYYEPVNKDVGEVLMFLVGWGYIEKEVRAELNSLEQIEKYPLFVGSDGRYYLSKDYRSRGYENINYFPKERFAYLLGKDYNYVEAIQPKPKEAPALFDAESYNLDFGGPYLSCLSINYEHEFNSLPLENRPDLITDVKVLRSWLFVFDIALRNVDAKFPNLSVIDLNIPGAGTRRTFMKIDPDFEISEHNIEITGARSGHPFAITYIEQRWRYWAFDKKSFSIDGYDLDAFRDAIKYVKKMKHKKTASEAGLPTSDPQFGIRRGGEIVTKKAVCDLIKQTKARIEEDAMRMLSLMVGVPVKGMVQTRGTSIFSISNEYGDSPAELMQQLIDLSTEI